MALRKISSSTKVTDAQRQLDKEQVELKKREAELTKLLVKIPKQIEKKKQTKLKADLAVPAISLGGARVSRGAQPIRRGKTRLSKDVNAARVKFLVLCVILLTIVVMLWRTIPS
jgi:hypothetical protein